MLPTTVIVIPEPTVRLQSNYYAVGEGDGSLQICAEVTTDQFEGNFQANYMTTGGSAKGWSLYLEVYMYGPTINEKPVTSYTWCMII